MERTIGPNMVSQQGPLHLGGLDVVLNKQGSPLHGPNAATIELGPMHLLEISDVIKISKSS